MKIVVRIVILLVLSVIFGVRCASISPPVGGPKDTLAPRVVSATPPMYTTNFKGKKVFIEFNEYIQLKDQSKQFFMSPAGMTKPRLTIKKRGVEVVFEEPLDSATTYRLDFGSSIADNNEGNALKGFSYVFSTGDVIDSLIMSGQVLNTLSQDSVLDALVFFFDARADSTQLDSTMFNARAEAIFRSDSSGFFVADVLKDKPYRIYAIEDKNGNQKYEPGTDLIGFANGTFDPTQLEDFTITYDSVRRRMIIDPLQVRFDMFMERPSRRQVLLKHERPERQKLVFAFANAEPGIDSLQLEGLDPEWIIREQNLFGDSLTMWIAPPTRELAKALTDTIRGSMTYLRPDSLGVVRPFHQKLSFTHSLPKVEELKKNTRKNEIKDSTKIPKPPNPFRFDVQASTPLNPEQSIRFSFPYPLRQADSSRIELYLIELVVGRDGKESKREVRAPFSLVRAPGDRHRYTLSSDWKIGRDYRLMIPSGTFEDITFASNDTLRSNFTVADPDKYGTIRLRTQPDSVNNSTYIIELLKGRGERETIEKRVNGVIPGQEVKLRYVAPGKYRLRIIEDANTNGRWDTGNLTLRVEPEKVRLWRAEDGFSSEILTKENWEVDHVLDLRAIFETKQKDQNSISVSDL